MAFGRLALRNLQQRVVSPCTSLLPTERSLQRQRWGSELLRRLSTAAGEERTETVAVSEGRKKSKIFPRRQRRRSLWRKEDRDFTPALWEFFPSGLGNALLQATENINRLVENTGLSRMLGRVKEDDKCYKLKYEVPGLGKEDVKIRVEDGMLTIEGEHKEEEEGGSESDDEFWSSRSYGFYNTNLMLPDDAKVDEIKAEMKDGVLSITIPRTERPKKDVKEIQVL